jgi:hypothetical protein
MVVEVSMVVVGLEFTIVFVEQFENICFFLDVEFAVMV